MLDQLSFINLGAPELLLVLLIMLLLFGGRKLPELARSLGNSTRELRKALDSDSSKKRQQHADSKTLKVS